MTRIPATLSPKNWVWNHLKSHSWKRGWRRSGGRKAALAVGLLFESSASEQLHSRKSSDLVWPSLLWIPHPAFFLPRRSWSSRCSVSVPGRREIPYLYLYLQETSPHTSLLKYGSPKATWPRNDVSYSAWLQGLPVSLPPAPSTF